MSVPSWFRPAHHLLVSFLLVTMLPAAALFWLSWRSLEQDRLLEAQRVREGCEQAADLLVTALQQKLAALELRQRLHSCGRGRRAGSGIRKRSRRITPKNRLLYYPAIPPVALGLPV